MSIMNEYDKYIMNVYTRYPLCIARARGKYVRDREGKKYLDFFTGISVSIFGHCHPAITKAINEQAKLFLHTSNYYYTLPQAVLAKALTGSSVKGRVFFSNSGTEANECAIKLARKWGVGRKEIIVFKNSFHGRTLGSLSATAQAKLKKGFTPLLGGFREAVFNDLSSVKRLINKKTCAVMIEPVQGEGGIHVAGKSFMKGLANLARAKKLLLIVDEVQSGMGRTGRFWAYRHYGIKPDIITAAKALGGGLPLGATIAAGNIADVFGAGGHGSTFGGNPVCAAAGLAVVKMLDEKILANVREKGAYFLKKLEALKSKYPSKIKEVRGLGLMLGMELKPGIDGKKVVLACLKEGVLLNCIQENVIRFLPPLHITRGDIDRVTGVLEKIIGRQK